jgi:hypothetical protein
MKEKSVSIVNEVQATSAYLEKINIEDLYFFAVDIWFSG